MIKKYVAERRIPFHMPGHKQGKAVHKILKSLLGNKVFKFDLTEVDNSDYLNSPTGVIQEAENLAAQAFGSYKTFFLINGSTVGNQAAILSIVGENDKIIVGRNAHQSTAAGIILSGAYPIYAEPALHKESGFYPVISPEEISRLISTHPNVRAVHLTSPTHIGFISNIKSIRELTLKHNIPLIVDEAHGSHFPFHSELPVSAIKIGADIIVQSTHKTIGSLTQTSMLHINHSPHINTQKMQSILSLLQSSSPSTLFIMSLDAARYQMATEGDTLLTKTLQLARKLRSEINEIPNLYCYGKEIIGQDDIYDLDETKILINVSKTGYTGYELEKILGRKYKVEVEMSDAHHILVFVTVGDTISSINSLLVALRDIAMNPKQAHFTREPLILPAIPPLQITPRQAFFASKQRVSLSASVGQICGEFVTPFPPDIPVIMPGEIITKDIVEFIKKLQKDRVMVVGPADTTLGTIQIIRS
jgi:arginine/lysine/ornithine decarboxylase